MAKKKLRDVPPKLTETEQDLLWHMEDGCELETDSLGKPGTPLEVLRRARVVVVH